MPNWCNNNLYIRHPDRAMIERAAKAWNSGALLQEFIPVPAELLATTAGFFGDEEKQKELDGKKRDNLSKYGYADWYNFCVTEWGTKWDIGKDKYDAEVVVGDDNSFSVHFESAWSPPVGAYSTLENMGFEIEAYYYEPGVGFCGSYMDGEDWEFSTRDPSRIPPEIRDMFGIEDEEDEKDVVNEVEEEDYETDHNQGESK